MKKKELMEKLNSLSAMEKKISSIGSNVKVSILDVAEILDQIKNDELFKCVRKDGKMCYRTFNKYLEHFNLSKNVRSAINTALEFKEVVPTYNIEGTSVFNNCSIEFWKEFKKINKTYWVNAVKKLCSTRENTILSVDDIKAYLKENPEQKVGYTGIKTVPTAFQQVISNVKKITKEEFETAPKTINAAHTKEERLALVDTLIEVANKVSDATGHGFVTKVDIMIKDEPKPYIFKDTPTGTLGTIVPDIYMYTQKQIYKFAASIFGIGAFLGLLIGAIFR